jgi:putative endopeptidase
MKKIGNKCHLFNDDWDDGCYDVNAYYYADQNKMVIPLGILQAPFFDMTKSVAWNYGGIGATIGHEITHAFDEDGHNYDHSGSWVNWWNESDKHKYSLLTNKVEKLYDGLKYMDGHVDGHLTFDENLADIGGLEIALEALNHVIYVNKINDIEEKKKMYKDFFLSFAMSWRLKDRPKKAKQSLLLDHHAPAVYRVNIPVAMFDEYYIAFNVSNKNLMYIDQSHRIKLFG